MSLSASNNTASDTLNVMPLVQLEAEYIESLNIKNTALIDLLKSTNGEAETQLSFNINANAAGKDLYRVILQIRLQVGTSKKDHFNLDLDYEGMFTITQASEEILPIILFVQCPHLMFPSVRHIVTIATQNSGLPPFHMQPINFMELFQQKMQEQMGNSANQS
jgi:preprotein translocase subunit SecB